MGALNLRNQPLGKKFLIPDSLVFVGGGTNQIQAVFGSTQYNLEVGPLIGVLPPNTVHYLYLTPSGIIQSVNPNSIGPAGESSWFLIGAFMSNGLTTTGFGAFINITGSPATLTPVSYTPIFVEAGTSTDLFGRYLIDGSGLAHLNSAHTSGTPGGGTAALLLPTGLQFDTDWTGAGTKVVGKYINNQQNSSLSGHMLAQASNADRLFFGGAVITSAQNDMGGQPGAVFSANGRYQTHWAALKLRAQDFPRKELWNL